MMVHRAHCRTRRDAKAALCDTIAIFCNRERRPSRIGTRTPEQAGIDRTRAKAASLTIAEPALRRQAHSAKGR